MLINKKEIIQISIKIESYGGYKIKPIGTLRM